MKRNKGVTLTECLVATAFMMLALGGMLALFVQNSRAGKIVDYSYVATNLAKNRVERIREVRREQGLAVLSSLAETDVLIDRNGVADTNGDFKRTTLIDTGYGTNLVKVTVQVNYKIRGSWNSLPVELVTVVCPYL